MYATNSIAGTVDNAVHIVCKSYNIRSGFSIMIPDEKLNSNNKTHYVYKQEEYYSLKSHEYLIKAIFM